jgi:hypothetical protein
MVAERTAVGLRKGRHYSDAWPRAQLARGTTAADGTGLTRLTLHPALDIWPAVR